MTAATKLKDTTCSLEKKPRQHIKTQRHPFAEKRPHNQSYGLSSSHVQMSELGDKKKAEHWRIKVFDLSCWRRLLRAPWTARRSNQSILRKSVLNIHWKDWCWSWSSSTLATWWEEPTHWKRPWCLKRLRAGGEGGDRGWNGWMASSTQWAWVWANWEMVKDREAWGTGFHGVTKNCTWLSDWTTAGTGQAF